MKIIEFLVKKLNLITILLAYLLYFILFLCKIDVSYGSVSFAIVHVIVLATLFYSIFRLIFPLNKTTKNTTSVKDKKTLSTQNSTKEKTTNKVKKDSVLNDKFYQVKQNPEYYFKEFTDRYELYKKTASGMQYVKTDYKKDLNK